MLEPQIVVNLLLELGISVDLVIHGYWPDERWTISAGIPFIRAGSRGRDQTNRRTLAKSVSQSLSESPDGRL